MANDRGGDFMRKKAFVVAALGLAAVLVAGGLVASNMGFKANYAMDGPGINGSASGTQTLSLPYNQQTSIVNAEDLIADIVADAGLAGVVASISRHVRTTDLPEFYTGTTGVNFAITPGDGYTVVVTASVNYIIVGSHNPTLSITLDGPGDNGSASGTQVWSYPYHSTAVNAEGLINEINAAAGASVVASVSRKVRTTDLPEFYTGTTGVNFTLTVGEAYEIVVTAGVTFVPAHY
jgi:hypothetical protein